MLEENKNTYATVDFADRYVSEHYTPHNPLAVHFSVLTDEEKETYLRKSLQEIERLHFTGRKYLVSQPLQFPRIRQGTFYGMSPTYASMFIGAVGENQTPECVKQAQVENALGILAAEISAVAVKNTSDDEVTSVNAQNCSCPLKSSKAYELLQNWIGGIYVC